MKICDECGECYYFGYETFGFNFCSEKCISKVISENDVYNLTPLQRNVLYMIFNRKYGFKFIRDFVILYGNLVLLLLILFLWSVK